MEKEKYWIAAISKEHAMRGVAGGFTQVCHGKEAPLKRMKHNDWIIIYSPKLSMDSDVKLQAFTAIGKVADDSVYRFEMSQHFIPFRRNIQFQNCAEISILPLIDKLNFIQNKSRWGYPFRMGFFEINEDDFKLVSSHMLNEDEKQNCI